MKGPSFISDVFNSLKLFQRAVFETTIMMYDPNLTGHLENIEGVIDQEITNILLHD